MTVADPAATARPSVAFLGPEGSFTHQAAADWISRSGLRDAGLIPLGAVGEVYAAVGDGSADYGVVAIENTVEGYVVPSLDAIVASADVVAVDETVLDIAFDAFVLADHGELTEVSAHPHGLAQCQRYVRESGLTAVPAASNASACRDLEAHQVALGPRLCGQLYGLHTLASAVQDFAGARTRFLTLSRREQALRVMPERVDPARRRTMLAITPTVTGPGVLSRITGAFGARGVNLSSLITRPIKAVEGRYVFVLTVDAAPWQAGLHDVLADLLAAGDSVKTLGVLPGRGELDEHLPAGLTPVGGVQAGASAAELSRVLLW